MKLYVPILIYLLMLFPSDIIAQDDQDSIEVFVIESFIPPENQKVFKVSFYTTEECKSTLFLNGNEVVISEELTDDHRKEVDISSFMFDSTIAQYYIVVENADGKSNRSELFELELPKELVIEGAGGYFFSCLVGGVFFLTPSVSVVFDGDDSYMSFEKELPFLAFYNKHRSNILGYISAGYQFTDRYEHDHLFKLGYKHLIHVPVIEYIAPGINGVTDFNGFNAVSPELSVGIVKLYNVFTIYARGRYTFQPGESGNEFYDVSIGLFSSFFTFHY